MPKATNSINAFTAGELSPRAKGRYDMAKYGSGASIMDNFLINQLGGALYRPGTRYVASTKDNGKARLFPFQYSSDQDYVVESGDLYFRLYSNGADIINITSNPVKYLLNANTGVDASFEFQDTGNTGHIVTAVGTAQTSNLQKKFGTTSLLLDGNSDLLSLADHANWDIAANYTIELMVKHTDHAGTECYIEQYVDATNYWKLEHIHGTGIHFQVDGGGADINISGGEITDTDWHHIVVCKVGADVGIYKDGVQVVDGNAACTTAFADLLSIGARIDPTNYLNGYIDEVRLTNANSFTAAPDATLTDTITVPTAAHTSDANTLLLLHCDTLDKSQSAHRIEFKETAQLDTAVKKWGTGSLLLDGNSDYLRMPDHVDWDIFANADDDWTVDFWVKHTDHAGTEYYFEQREDVNNTWQLYHTHGAGITLYFREDGNIRINETDIASEIADTNWHHVALVKVEDDFGLYLDGTQTTWVGGLANFDTFAANLDIGANNAAGSFFDGNMDDIRFYKGNVFSAAPNVGKTDTIVIPTAEVNADTITSTEITTPYAEADVFALNTTQYNDVMYVCHPSYAPYKLSRTGSSAFTLDLVDFVRPPLMDTNITAVTITPSADTGAGITLTASAATFDLLHVDGFFRVKEGIVKITAYTSSVAVTGDVQAEPDGTAGDCNTGPAATTDWAEGSFSDYRGWPTAAAFHEQRLYYANTSTEPQKFWGSYIGAYDSFDTTATTDNYSLTVEVATEQRTAIQWLSSGNRSLTLGTIGGTFSASSSNTLEAISPTNIVVNRDTNYGVAALSPKRISSFLYYVQRDFKKLRELSYSFNVDATISNDMTLLADHVLADGTTIVDVDQQQSPNDRIYCVRADGEMAVLTRNPEQEVMGWCRFEAGLDSSGETGKYESVAVIPKSQEQDQVWVVVNRSIGGVTKRFIEYFMTEDFDEDWDGIRLDSSLTLDSPITITGVTTATPPVVTAASHGLSNGDQIKINCVVGMTELNGNDYLVADKTADTFELQDTSSVDIVGAGYADYISSGEARKMVTAITGLDHLDGETVYVQTDGYVPTTATYTVVAGGITLSELAAVVHAGLAYTGTLTLLKLSDGSPTGTGQTRTRRIFKGTLRLDRSQGLNIGRASGVTSNNLQYDENVLFTGDKKKVFSTSWADDDEIVITQTKPLPANILAVVFRSETSEG